MKEADETQIMDSLRNIDPNPSNEGSKQKRPLVQELSEEEALK